MTALRTLLCLVFAFSALGLPMAAHSQGLAAAGDRSLLSNIWYPTNSRSSLGLSVGPSQRGMRCGSTALLCDNTDRAAQLYAGAMVGNFWGVELGYADSGRLAGAGGESRAQGLNLSLVGKAPLSRSLGVFGKLGTTYGRTDTSIMGGGPTAGADQGFGLSYGAGMSFAFTPRLSATVEWDSNDFRFAGNGRDPVRSTSLGLRYRY
ncbi:MAG: outer membrane protein precursor-like protein [Ramlibacter sp.]|nr:outer membrane protein precursor-like protein [Ramlibacter sp.]